MHVLYRIDSYIVARRRPAGAPDFDLIQTTGTVLNDVAFPSLDDESSLSLNIVRDNNVFSKNRLRLNDDVDWKSQIGHVYSYDATDGVSDLGLNWISGDINDNPNRDMPRPYYEIQNDLNDGVDINTAEEQPIDRFYGVHGGMISPMLSDGDKLHLISHYGKLDDINNNDSEIARGDNLQWVTYDSLLNKKIPQLTTNDTNILQILESLTTITDSILGFDDDRFFLKPRRVTDDVTHHTLDLNQDTLEEPIDAIVIENDMQNLYNQIDVRYGEGNTYFVEDDASIRQYGARRLEMNVILDDTQENWASWIANRYLENLKTLRHIIRITAKPTLYMELGDVVMLKCSERDALNRRCQLVEARHNIITRQSYLVFVSL